MKLNVPTFMLVNLLLFTAFLCFSQSSYNFTLTKSEHREEINFLGSEQNVHVCGLSVGETYQVWAVKQGCHPTLKLTSAPGQFSNTQVFVATSDCMDFVMKKDNSSPQCSAGTVWFSIGCSTCKKKGPDPFSKIIAGGGGSAQSLIQDVFIGGGCFDVTNVVDIGPSSNKGTFDDGASSIIINSGVIIASGPVTVANGPNNSDGAGSNSGGPNSDPDLNQLAGGALNNVSGIEFDFRPTISTINFNYVFASEEYCEFAPPNNAGFNDVFGFFISGPGISGGFSFNGQDIAVLPSSGVFVSINNVNPVTNSSYFVPNQNNCGGTTNMADIQFDGWTALLTAVANVVPCETYHIRLVIGDVGDGIYDSAVFLEAGSFNAGGTATADATALTTGTNQVYESCNDGSIVFHRAGGNNSLPLVLSFTVLPSSTATPGADYAPFPLTIVIPPGVDEFALPINVVNDGIPEGVETIVLSLSNSCSCSSLQFELQIIDPPPLSVTVPDLESCAASPIFIDAVAVGGIPSSNYTFNWSNGQSGPTLQAAPTSNTTYTVTATDVCGATATATSNVQVSNLPSAILDSPGGTLCPNGNPNAMINMEVDFTGTPNWILDYTINGQPQPSVLVTSTPYTISSNIPGIYLLTSVTSQIGNCVGPATGVAIIELANIQNTVMTTPYTCSNNGTMTVTPNGGTTPYNYTWSNGFPSFETAIGLLPGTYTVTVSDMNGCTASSTGIITAPPPLVSNAVGSQISCTNPNGGTVNLTVGGGTAPFTYLWSNSSTQQNLTGLGVGNYQATVTDADGCTSTAAASVTSNVALPVAVASAPNGLDCDTHITTVFGQGSQTGPNILYSWSGPGINGPNNQIDVNVEAGGLYTLIVTNASNGCTSEASVDVPLNNAAPIAVATGNTLNCNESATTVSGVGSSTGANFTYQWTGSNIITGEDEIDATVGEAGTYTLVVTNSVNGCTSSTTATVLNNANAPTATIAPPVPLTCSVNTVNLDGSGSSSGPIYTYQWYQNGNPIPGATNQTTQTSSTGNYQIVVTNTSSGCTAGFTTTVTNNLNPPVASATAVGQITCTNNSVSLNGTVIGNPSEFTFAWSSADGSFSGGTNAQNATASAPGIYEVTATSLLNGCTGTASVEVVQDANIPIAQVISSGNIDCVDTQVQLNGNGSSQSPTITYTWTTPDGHFYSGQNTLTPVVDAAGTYTLTLHDSSNQCENEISTTVTVDNVLPTINLPTAPMLDCETTQATLNVSIPNAPSGGGLTYAWTTIGGEISPSNVLTPNITAPGTYNLVVTNPSNSCTSSASLVIDEDIAPPVIAIATPDVLTCTNNTVPLNATGTSTGIAFTYNWSSTTGNFASSNTILNPVVNEPGTYVLEVTNTLNHCSATQEVFVDEDVDLPNALVGLPQTLTCELTELQLNGIGSSLGSEFQYLWTGPGPIVNEGTLSPTVQEPGTYQLLVTNLLNNCQSTASVAVVENVAPPTAEAGPGGVLSCSQTNMVLNGSGSSTGNNFTYEWDSPNGSIFGNGTTLNPTINAPGDYILTVTNTVNGCTSSDMVTIDQDASLPAVVVQPAQPLTCNVTEINLNGTGTVTGSEFTYLWSTATGNILAGDSTLSPIVDAPGIYLLNVTNTLTNCSNIASVTVAAQTTPPVVEAGPTVQLTCTQNSLNLSGNGSASGANYSYLWTTLDGNIIGDNTIINPVVDEPGTYVLQVTNIQTGCTNTDQVIVSQSLNAPISVASTPGILNCTTTNLLLSGAGSSTGNTYSYLWTTNDGNIQLGQTTLSPQINEPGTYVLTVSNSLNGCTKTASVVVDQDITAPIAEAGTANLLSCNATIQDLDGNGSSAGGEFSYLWTTTNGNILNGATTLTPTINQIGTYILTVTNTTNGCTNSDNVLVGQDNSLPQAVIAPPALLTCTVQEQNLTATASQGANFEYLWTTNGGNILGDETTLSPQINQPGVYILTVTNTDNGCTLTTQASVAQDVELPTADAGQPYIMDCFEEFNTLDGSGSTGSGLLAFLWSTVDGTIVSGSNAMNAAISDPGTYSLLVTNTTNGCTNSDQVTITREGPVTEPVATQPPCFGDKGAITLSGASGGVTPYLYSVDNGEHFSNSAIFTNLVPGLYTAVVQDANGCEFDKQVSIVQPDQFDIFVEPQVTIKLGESYQLNTQVNLPVSEIEQVNWFPTFNLSCADCLDPIATPPTSTTYTVTVVTKNGCKDDAPVFFRVDKTGGVYVPNAFSPNGDGSNDVFMIFSDTKSVSKVKSFLVFNRWGETVYQYFDFAPNDPAKGWDGKHRGQYMDPAVFTWFAEIEFIDGRVELFKGDVTLLN